jgi:hypothetical protein
MLGRRGGKRCRGRGGGLQRFHGHGRPDVVYVEGLIGNLYLERPDDFARYREAFEDLRDYALSPRDSVERIAEIPQRRQRPSVPSAGSRPEDERTAPW